MWQEFVVARDFGSFDRQPAVLDDIVSLGKAMGLDVDSNDVEELVEYHRSKLTTKELQDLHGEQQETLEEISSEEEDSKRNISTAEIKELCYHWEMTQRLAEKWHPNTAVISRSINLFNDNVIDHFKKILKNRQRQTTLDKFIKQKSQDSSSIKKQKKEKTGEGEKTSELMLSDVSMDSDSFSKP